MDSSIYGSCVPELLILRLELELTIYLETFAKFLCLYSSAFCLVFLFPLLGGLPKAGYFGGSSVTAAVVGANGFELDDERNVFAEYDVPPAF